MIKNITSRFNNIKDKNVSIDTYEQIFIKIFGLYLFCHFVMLIPYAEETFSSVMPYDHHLLGVRLPYVNMVDWCNATVLTFILSVVSLLFTFGKRYNKFYSFVLWYGWYCLFTANVLINNPGLPYVGWLLLAHSLTNVKRNRVIYIIAWTLLMAGYTASGIHKLTFSPSWSDGTALASVLSGPLARSNFITELLLSLPTWALKLDTWTTLILEISALPLGCFYYTRAFYWLMFMGLHLGILLTVNFADLTLGMIMIHIYVMPFAFSKIYLDVPSTISK